MLAGSAEDEADVCETQGLRILPRLSIRFGRYSLPAAGSYGHQQV